MIFILKRLTFTIFILLLLFVLYILKEAGVFRDTYNHFIGTTEVISSPPGLEDITIDQETGIAYISSSDRRNRTNNGNLYRVDLKNDTTYFSNLSEIHHFKNFKPHGISFLKTSSNKKYLFVINHAEKNEVIRFSILNDSLLNPKVFTHPLMISPNDIHAIGENEFYFTNDHGAKSGFDGPKGDFVKNKSGYVVYFNNGNAFKTGPKMGYPNGINVSPDHKYLYVTATIENKLYVFKNTPGQKQLELLDEKYLETSPDNIELDKYGNLLIGTHPKTLMFLKHAKNENNRSPSAIIKVVYLPERPYRFLQELLYMNDGDPLSGSSVGAYYEKDSLNNDLLVGGVFDSILLRLHRKL